MSAPVVPQRPARSQQQQSAESHLSPSSASPELPRVPPRPARRNGESDAELLERDAFARSPLNDSPFAANLPGKNNGLYLQNKNLSASNLPARPPSVSALPMIGQEGMEYGAFDKPLQPPPAATASEDAAASPNQTSNVARDLPLHAPRATIPAVAAKSQIATVTRTDSGTAARAGIGKSHTDFDESTLQHHTQRPPSSRSGHYRPPSTSFVRPDSTPARVGSAQEGEEDEHGIPHIGLHVPMYPNAGDVQAPSPGPNAYPQSTGVGFFNDGSQPGRRRSAQGFHVPPGSYGLHGHGILNQDRFETDWYQKHPEELKKEEHGAYGPSMASLRSEWAMSSEELNKLVHDHESSLPGMGTRSDMIGTPTEFVAHAAAAKTYAKLTTSQSPEHETNRTKPDPQNYTESPLRRVYSADPENQRETDDTNFGSVHVDQDVGRKNKTHGTSYIPPKDQDLGPEGGNTEAAGGWFVESGTGTPILASDELSKNPRAQYMHPVIGPEQMSHDESYYQSLNSERRHSLTYGNRSGSRSRPTSRPSSVHGLSRYNTHEDGIHTPLAEIDEYEPLFNDEDEEDGEKRPSTAADRFKRPELDNRRFPSQDVWEDTPTSLQLQTTVTREQEPLDKEAQAALATTREGAASTPFESPDKEAARRGEVTEAERLSFLTDPSKGFAKPKFRAGVQEEVQGRPGVNRRFPSQDIWEDTPDSQNLTTSIDPSTGIQFKSPTGPSALAQSDLAKSVSTSLDKPMVPSRPAKKMDIGFAENKAPITPEPPKPQVPARPARASQEEIHESDAPLTKTLSSGSTESTDTVKAKPAVPSKPVGSSKFASIKAGFMNDLNSRLQLGPQAPKKPEPVQDSAEEEEKAPLADARKGRARGPARRKPAESAESAETATAMTSAATSSTSTAAWGFSTPQTLWHIATEGPGSGHVHVVSTSAAAVQAAPQVRSVADLGEIPTASPLSTNTAGESLINESAAPQTASGELAHATSNTMDERAAREEAVEKSTVHEITEQQIGHYGDVPEPAPAKAFEPSLEAKSRQDAIEHESTGIEGVKSAEQLLEGSY